jgi:hypothetical protein
MCLAETMEDFGTVHTVGETVKDMKWRRDSRCTYPHDRRLRGRLHNLHPLQN